MESILTVGGPMAYVIVGLLVFAEAALFVGLVLPGETAVLLGGVLAATGHVSLPILLAVVVIAAVAGDSVGYEVGHHSHPSTSALPGAMECLSALRVSIGNATVGSPSPVDH